MKPGEVTVAFDYSRHLGPRFVHGAVTLRFSGADSFAFSSSATWPTSEDYTSAIEAAVRDVLASKGALNRTACKLVAIRWDDISSCQAGFSAAARAAVLAAFEV